jgi:hypothetical protein
VQKLTAERDAPADEARIKDVRAILEAGEIVRVKSAENSEGQVSIGGIPTLT